MTETSDNDLIEILDQHRERIGQILDHRGRNPMARPLNTTPAYDEMVKQVASALAAHPVLKRAWSIFILSRQIGLWPGAQAGNLLEQAARVDGKSALAWLYRVWNTKAADIDIITEVHGLLVRKAVTFSNGVRLVPPGEMIDTPQARLLVAQSSSISMLSIRFPVAGVITMKDVPAVENDGHNDGHKRYLEKIETIRRTVTALSLSDKHTPTTSVSWIDFNDPDLIATSFGYMWQGATYDGRQADHPVEMTPVAVEWAERFLALKGSVASKCDVALARLNLARRRQTPGDKAIDGCIALEALLADGQPGDLTYKLKLRAARLLGPTYAERQEVSGAIGRFYRLRGKVVHGQSTGASQEDREVAERGLELVLAVLRKIVASAQIPGISELELGPAD